jgi:hypothetical protein
MFKRLMFLSIMIAAVGVPYLASSSSDWLKSFKGQFSAETGTKTAATTNAPAFEPAPGHGAPATPTAALKSRPVEGFGAHDLGEVLQFNGTPSWVMARWPRVTASLAELNLQGYRVPLVTGTAEDDLAGSLTYYFDKDQHVAHINFHGTTGDPRKLVSLVVSRYSFVRQPSDDPSLSLYQVKWNGKPLSELRIRPAHVVRADQPHSRYEVDLAMKRP